MAMAHGVLLVFLSLMLSTASSTPSFSPTTAIRELGRHAGYYSLPHSRAARMFYIFVESKTNRNDLPVIMWLGGGPGSTSLYALFFTNGPVNIANNASLLPNDFGWDKDAHLLYVDQPIGTGFSYSSDGKDIRKSLEDSTEDLYDFLQAFFKDHCRFANNSFYIAGESYAGHFIPAIASRIQRGNRANPEIHLKGIAMGNGNTNPGVEYGTYVEYALSMKLINSSVAERINKLYHPRCQRLIKSCELLGGEKVCTEAGTSCEKILDMIVKISGVSKYDVRKKEEPPMLATLLLKFLNNTLVRDALGVGDREFVPSNGTVFDALDSDFARNYESKIPPLLEDGIKVLIYAGEFDFICNWLDNWRWVHGMKWRGQKRFVASPNTTFTVDGVKGGELKSYGPLAFLKIHKAGHAATRDQPKVTLKMMREWLNGKL